MNFTTKIPLHKSQHPISYKSTILLFGSCFAENMAAKLEYFKFNNTTNPFGIIFNPVSIEKLIKRCVENIPFTEKDIFFHNNLWHCYEVHSKLSNANKEVFLSTLNGLISATNKQLNHSTHLIITYGTSWVYRNNASNEIVANCHKVPQNQFRKELLSIETIEKSIQNCITLIQNRNPKVTFIFTISPVRHIKDGFVENNLSKAHLIAALHQVLQVPPLGVRGLFPSYEIMIDELRDYRFYEQDMLHPNQTAIDYIWERFSHFYIAETCHATMKEVESIQKSLLHRSFNPDSEGNQNFLINLQHKINSLTNTNPNIQF